MDMARALVRVQSTCNRRHNIGDMFLGLHYANRNHWTTTAPVRRAALEPEVNGIKGNGGEEPEEVRSRDKEDAERDMSGSPIKARKSNT